MPQSNNSSSQNRKQHIRVRESTALLPAAFVESPPPPLIKNEIVDLEYGVIINSFLYMICIQKI